MCVSACDACDACELREGSNLSAAPRLPFEGEACAGPHPIGGTKLGRKKLRSLVLSLVLSQMRNSEEQRGTVRNSVGVGR
jgi:hypothetical protein